MTKLFFLVLFFAFVFGCGKRELTYTDLVTAIEAESKELERLESLVKSMEDDVSNKGTELKRLLFEGRQRNTELYRRGTDELASVNAPKSAHEDLASKWKEANENFKRQDEEVSTMMSELKAKLAIQKAPLEERIEEQIKILSDLRSRRDKVRP